MTRYYLSILGWYSNSDRTEHRTIECDGVDACSRGDYMFWIYVGDGKVESVAHYPIKNTIISKIEKL